MDEKLKPCPACGGAAVQQQGLRYVSCVSTGCHMIGPDQDRTGSKWDALPRRTDAPAGMSDGELIARAILQVGIAMLAQRGTFRETAPGTLQAMNDELTNELNRRAAARKEAAK